MTRKRSGHRRHGATFQKRADGVDEHGHPEHRWEFVVGPWYTEMVSTRGGEVVRGRQTTAQSTHVLFGEWSPALEVLDTDMRCVVNGEVFGIASVLDADGLRQEIRVELKREV